MTTGKRIVCTGTIIIQRLTHHLGVTHPVHPPVLLPVGAVTPRRDQFVNQERLESRYDLVFEPVNEIEKQSSLLSLI